MKVGDDLHHLIQGAERNIQSCIDELNLMPVIEAYSAFYWNGYQLLSSDRPPSMGGGLTSIPFSSIFAYVQFLKMTEREADTFIRIIKCLDNRHIALVKSKIAENEKSARKGKPSS
jgi:hypothetical protein